MENVQTKNSADLDSGRRPKLKPAEFLFVHSPLLRYLRFWSRSIGDFQTHIGISSRLEGRLVARRVAVLVELQPRDIARLVGHLIEKRKRIIEVVARVVSARNFNRLGGTRLLGDLGVRWLSELKLKRSLDSG